VVWAKIRPGLRQLRIMVESALVLIALARAAQPDLREQAALEAMEVGARRLDFIGMKFQCAEEIAQMDARASTPINANTITDLNDIASPLNGRINDLKEGYVLGRERSEQAWGNEHRPTWLGTVTNRCDVGAQLWIQRSDRMRAALAQFRRAKTLPSMEELGIPRPKPVP